MLYRSLSQLERQFGRDGKRAWYDSAAWRAYGPRYGQGTLRSLRPLWRPADQPEPITRITAPARPAARPRQIGRAHVCTPVTNAHLECRLLLSKKQARRTTNHTT